MLAWMSGVFIGSRFFVSEKIIFIWLIALGIGGIFRKRWGIGAIIVIGIFLAGVLRMNHSLDTYQRVRDNLIDQDTYQVVVDSSARIRSYGMQYQVIDRQTGARYFLTTRSGKYKYGQVVAAKGNLSYPENPAIQRYLLGKNIHSYVSARDGQVIGEECSLWCQSLRSIQSFKEWFMNLIDRAYPGRVGEFLKGILVGYTDTLPEETKEAFRRTGVTHILAVSGYNVSIFVVLIYQSMLNWQIHRRYSALLTILVVGIFTLMTGAEASIIRASLFASILLVGEVMRRYASGWYPLLLCASIMLAVNPTYIAYDIGFQLSFLAVIGLMLYGNLFDTFSQGLPALTLKSLIGETVAAQIMVLPILVYHFGEFSVISILANALIVPLIPLAMLWGFVSSILYSLIPVPVFTVPLELLIESLIFINQTVANVPWAMLEVPSIEIWQVGVSYLILGFLGWLPIRYRHHHV